MASHHFQRQIVATDDKPQHLFKVLDVENLLIYLAKSIKSALLHIKVAFCIEIFLEGLIGAKVP